jgi:hypothetical protein
MGQSPPGHRAAAAQREFAFATKPAAHPARNLILNHPICGAPTRQPPSVRLWKCALRIFPTLIVLSVLTVFVLGLILTKIPRMEYFQSPATYAYLWNIALAPRFSLPGVLASNPFPVAVNGSLWTLPAEFPMHILLPVYAWRRHPVFGDARPEHKGERDNNPISSPMADTTTGLLHTISTGMGKATGLGTIS